MFSLPHRSTLLCSTFVKFVRREIGEIVRYLADKKFGCLSNCHYCADHAQNLPGPAPNNVIRVLQISPKSVNFRRSYIRMREHRQIAPYTKSSRIKKCSQPKATEAMPPLT